MCDEYLLGHSAREWDRLKAQHALWRDTLLCHLPEMNGQRVLELGCGNGTLLAELAEMVGPFGQTVAIERDELAATAARAAAPDADVRTGDLMDTDLGGPHDLIVARWVFSFLPDPAAAIRRAVERLAPGGRILIQDYNHDGVRVFPRLPAFERAISAYRAAYAASGGDLWIGPSIPGMLRAAGLRVDTISPAVKTGPPGSPTWRWVERFVFEHLPTITASSSDASSDALLSPGEVRALREQWERARRDADALLFSPIQVCVVGQKLR